jgi:ribosomal protein S18 acetylase RimI-like enzyme
MRVNGAGWPAGRFARFVRQHGVWSVVVAVLRLVTAWTGITFVTCLHRPTTGTPSRTTARRLDPDELEGAAADGAIDLSREFLSTAPQSACYGVVRDGKVRAYAWAGGPEPTPVAYGLSVTMPVDLVYVYKAFTAPEWRGQNLLAECVSAIENDTARGPQRCGLAVLVDVENFKAHRAFRRLGFHRCGYVAMVPWARKARPLFCTHASCCVWEWEATRRQRIRSVRRSS